MTPNEKAFWNLATAARAEGGISPEEQRVLNAHTIRLGLDPHRARALQSEVLAQETPHLRAGGDLESMRALLEVAAADGSISPAELAVARTLARHLGITNTGLETLMKAALGRSAARRDKAFSRVKASGPEAEVALQRPVAERGSVLHSVPILARLAPASRPCAKCGFPFADRNPYSATCRVCRTKPEPTAITQEAIFVVLWVAFMIPTGYLLRDLWSWAWAASASSRWGRRRGGQMYLPIIATAGIAWLAAWGVTWLARYFLKPRGL